MTNGAGQMEFVRIDHVQLAAPVETEAIASQFLAQSRHARACKPANHQKRGGVWFKVGSNELHIRMAGPANFHPNKMAHPLSKVRTWRTYAID
ncbi:MAG TPA: hypothetical protein VLV18_10560 [Terriglobales bacterium]|nr:hypothetical protein [Terriglobales bacterium]